MNIPRILTAPFVNIDYIQIICLTFWMFHSLDIPITYHQRTSQPFWQTTPKLSRFVVHIALFSLWVCQSLVLSNWGGKGIVILQFTMTTAEYNSICVMIITSFIITKVFFLQCPGLVFYMNLIYWSSITEQYQYEQGELMLYIWHFHLFSTLMVVHLKLWERLFSRVEVMWGNVFVLMII